jgi:hypothetical protein
MGIGEGRFGGLFVLVLLVLVLVLVLVLWCGVLGWAVPRRARVLRSTVRTSAEGFLAWFLDPGFASLSLRRLPSTAPDDIVDRVDFTEKELCN